MLVVPLVSIYNEKYLSMLLVPAVLAVLFLAAIFVFPRLSQGIDLIGGTEIRVSLEKDVSTADLAESILKQFNLTDLQVKTTQGPLGSKVLIQFSFNKDLKQAQDLLEQAKAQRESNPQNAALLALASAEASKVFFEGTPPQNPTAGSAILFAEDAFNNAKENFANQFDSFLIQKLELGENPRISRDQVGAVLGETFYSSGLTVALIAFILIVIVIFVFFREIIPSAAVIAAALFDMGGALALMAVFGVPVSLATIPAVLMLIGYSVDTDIMLTTRLLKRKEKDLFERANDAIVTGMTMTLTTLAALIVMLVLSYFSQIEIIFQIAAVLVFGLFADIVSTWLMNAPVLLWYAERKKKVVA